MRKLLCVVCVVGIVMCCAVPLYAGGIENKHNFSAEWVRTLNRNGATDSADIVVYNPAGTAQMAEGFYLNLSGQYAAKTYTNGINNVDYESDKPDFVPSFFALYRKNNWGLFGAFNIPVGGGGVEFDKGSATTAGLVAGLPFGPSVAQYMEGESYYYGLTFGGSYKLNDMVSFSAGARYADANIERSGYAKYGFVIPPLASDTVSVDYEETGDGWGGIFGVNLAPNEKVNIGLRYETETSLDLETKQNKDTLDAIAAGLITDGAKRKRNIPALLGAGLSYKFAPKWRTEINYTRYFNDGADWDDIGLTAGDETKKDDGYDIGISLEYEICPQWKVSAGYMYTETGIDPDNMSKEAPELDATTLAGGFAWQATPRWAFNFGVLKTFYKDETTTPVAGVFPTGVVLEKDVWIFALGVQCTL